MTTDLKKTSTRKGGIRKEELLAAGANGFRAVALDLDGTAKMDGKPFNPFLADRIGKLRATGVKVILATGRSVAELERLVSTELFDAIVAENGAVLVMNGVKTILAPSDWIRVRNELANVLGQGSEEVVISLDRERLEDAERLVRDRARIELNKDRIMVVPKGLDKGTGLLEALKKLGISDGVACVGDGENDLSMFRVANHRIALENSVDLLKKEADYVARRPDGDGAADAIDELILSNPAPDKSE